jgi:Holliday junction resolvase RusA-like endonuclease
MTQVFCEADDCKWCECGFCKRGEITINCAWECDSFESYRDSYTDSYYIVCGTVEKPCEIFIEWHEKTKRRDVDNIQSAQKFILDALQQHNIIKNDSRKYVKQIHHTVIDDKRDFVIVRIEEREN